MDGLALLGEARGAGLTVSTDGEKLMIQGPGASRRSRSACSRTSPT